MNAELEFNEQEFDAGYDAFMAEYVPDEPTGEPVGVHEDYLCGWWCALGEMDAICEGMDAAEKNIFICPYAKGTDSECFRESWLNGYRMKLVGLSMELHS